MLTVGIDIGTTHTKAVLLNGQGTILQQYKQGYTPTQSQPGYHELDADEIFEAVLKVLQQIFDYDKTGEIKAISFSAAMHGIMAVNQDGVPLTKIITWADTRSKSEAAALTSSPDARQIYEHTGTPIHPMSPLCKLLWWRKHEPTLIQQAHKFLSFKEYVVFKLTGEYKMDHSIASATGLFNIHDFAWHKPSLALAGITAEHLPALCSIDQKFSTIHPQYLQKTGISNTVSWFMGGSDGAMANIGSGALLKGIASLTIGTSAAIRTVLLTATLDNQQRLFCYAITPHSFICGGPLNNGGLVAKWFYDNVMKVDTDPLMSFDDAVSNAFAGDQPSGLIFLPHLLGERAVQWDAFAKAAFIGMTALHTQQHLLRSIFEGISFALLAILEAMEESGMEMNTIVAGGGFTASAEWPQLIADIFNKNIMVQDDGDASAKGAALHAFGLLGHSIENNPSINAQQQKVYYARAEKHQQYLPYYKLYKTLYPLLKDTFAALDELQRIPGAI